MPSAMSSPDAALLAACAEFEATFAEQMAAGAEVSDEAMGDLAAAWSVAMDRVAACPAPTTPAGTVALASAAFTALLWREVPSPRARAGWRENSSRIDVLALEGLAAMTGRALP